MNLRTGDMWDVYDEVDLFLFTANNAITREGRLVMGAGMAKQVKNRFYNIDSDFGTLVMRVTKGKPTGKFGLVTLDDERKLGAFQTKNHWRFPSRPEILLFSAYKLEIWCQENPGKTVALNFPGIGHGGMNKAEVWKLLRPILPAAVTIWEAEDGPFR